MTKKTRKANETGHQAAPCETNRSASQTTPTKKSAPTQRPTILHSARRRRVCQATGRPVLR